MKSIKDVNFKGKKVLVRVDFNVPLDEHKHITDDTRICEAVPTINKLVADGAKIILIAHLGRPKKNGFDEEFSLKPIADYLEKLLDKKVIFIQKLLGEEVEHIINNMKDGDIFLLENIRFYPEETKGDEAFAKKIAALGECYINDAFGSSHRLHCSTAVIAKFFPNDRYFGFLMEYEVKNLNRLMRESKKPFTAIIGGSKISSKIKILESLLDIADNILIGGGMVFTFLKAQGKEIGKSLCEDDCMQVADNLMKKAKIKRVKVFLPIDVVEAEKFDNNAIRKEVSVDKINSQYMGMDIGEKTAKIYFDVIAESKTILWNGPMGVFEMSNFRMGTKAMAEAIAEATANGAFSTVGGGDSVAAINMFGFADKVSFISTGGGAMLEYVENGTLPGIDAINENR
ncbi:MAG: phosphoglycerate kinase [Bacteroidales bacterium]|jgi:phosphoglycerate kinase|nr:phosphoglycerate kinase [Bacteroidales bacterium]